MSAYVSVFTGIPRRKLLMHAKQLGLHCLNCELQILSTLAVLFAALCYGVQSNDCTFLTCALFLIDCSS